MYVAVLRRLRAREERFAEYVRAGGTGQLARVTVDLDEPDTVWHLEGRARAPGQRGLHERRPDRQGGLRAGERDRLVVVEAHPDHGEQVGREADEPSVAPGFRARPHLPLATRGQLRSRDYLTPVASSLSGQWCMLSVCHALTWISTMRRARRSCAVTAWRQNAKRSTLRFEPLRRSPSVLMKLASFGGPVGMATSARCGSVVRRDSDRYVRVGRVSSRHRDPDLQSCRGAARKRDCNLRCGCGWKYSPGRVTNGI